MVQVKTKEVKMIKRLSWNENLHLFGWVQNNKEVFSADNNLQLRTSIIVKCKHKGTKGVKYQDVMQGIIGIAVQEKVTEVATKAIKSCGMKGGIFHMTYHSMNKGSKEQGMYALELALNNKHGILQ